MINLLQNPFALIGATIQDPPDAIRGAAARAVESGQLGEEEARAAAATLLNPKARLDAEVSWLLGRSAPRIGAILTALGETPDTAGRLALLETIDGVARANLAAHLCAVERGGVSIVRAMVEAQNEIAPESVWWLVNGNRERAGLPAVSEEALRAALESLQSQHCAAVCAAISAREEHRKFMVRLFADGWSPPGPAYVFLERVVDAYNAWYDAHLAAIETDLDRHYKALLANPDDAKASKGLKQCLALWDEYSMPLTHPSLDDSVITARADALHRRVGELSVHLARNCGRFRAALQLAESLGYAFPDHPPVTLPLPENLAGLGPMLAHLGPGAAPRKLAEAIVHLMREPRAVATGLERGGFVRGDRGPAGELYMAFSTAMAETYGTTSGESIWIILRCLALDLRRRHGHTAGALALLESLLAQGEDYVMPAEIRRLLENDSGHLRFEISRRAIESLLARGRLHKAARMVEAELLDPPTEAAREDLVSLQQAIREGRAGTPTQQALWILALALLACALAVVFFATR